MVSPHPVVCHAEALFWVDFAQHLLSAAPGQPFVPSDPTGAAASTASIVTALAVCDLPWEGRPAAAANADSSSTGMGCSRSYSGSTMTLTAQAPCLVWVKQVRPVAKISHSTVDTGTAGGARAHEPLSTASDKSSQVATNACDWISCSSSESLSSTNTVMVTQRLYDPQTAVAVDQETGEQLLLSLEPSEQKPLLIGHRYCMSIIITSISPSVQLLDVLVQVSIVLQPRLQFSDAAQ